MAKLLPNTTIYSTRGNSSSPTEKIGGAAFGITDGTTVTAGQPITVTYPVISGSFTPHDFVRPKQKTTPGVYNATGTRVNGVNNFAYLDKRNARNWLVFGVGTGVNGSGTNAFLINGPQAFLTRRNLKQKQYGAYTSASYRQGFFKLTRNTGSRTQWTTAPSGLTNTYKLPTDNTVDSTDQGIFVTYRAIPGELTYLYGALAPSGADYKPKYGA